MPQLPRTTPRALSLALAALICALPAAAYAETYQVTCYPVGPAGDADGDGYAAQGSQGVVLQVDRDDRLSCPDGWVKRATDCDDTNASIHPRRAEIPFNGVDDNCNGQADETEPIYYAQGNGNTVSSFDIRAKINDANILQHAADLYVRVVLNPLDSSTLFVSTPLVKVTGLSQANPYVEVTVASLSPFRVYNAQLRFYRPLLLKAPAPIASLGTDTATGDDPVATTQLLAPTGATETSTATSSTTTLLYATTPVRYLRVGGDSLWYTTTTDSTSTWGKLRTDILLKAFKEVEESRQGKVGYWGSVAENGTRYGADIGDLWCSEFYRWNAGAFVPLSGNTVDGLKTAFKTKGAYYTDVEGVAERGDWLHTTTHSTMFLALDTVIDTYIWTVEGNLDNEVRIERRLASDYLGVGHLQSSLFWPF